MPTYMRTSQPSRTMLRRIILIPLLAFPPLLSFPMAPRSQMCPAAPGSCCPLPRPPGRGLAEPALPALRAPAIPHGIGPLRALQPGKDELLVTIPAGKGPGSLRTFQPGKARAICEHSSRQRTGFLRAFQPGRARAPRAHSSWEQPVLRRGASPGRGTPAPPAARCAAAPWRPRGAAQGPAQAGTAPGRRLRERSSALGSATERFPRPRSGTRGLCRASTIRGYGQSLGFL